MKTNLRYMWDYDIPFNSEPYDNMTDLWSVVADNQGSKLVLSICGYCSHLVWDILYANPGMEIVYSVNDAFVRETSQEYEKEHEKF